MRFEVTHSFEASVDDVAQTLLDTRYQASLSDLGPLAERTVLSQEASSNGSVVRRTRYVLDIRLSGMAKSLLGDAKPAWIEQATWEPETTTWTWTIEPEVARELLDAAGTIELRGARAGTTRTVTGDVRVKVPLYGSKVERWIVDGIRKTYEEEADRLARWLASPRS